MTRFCCCRPLVRQRSDTFCCRTVPPMAFRCPMPSNRETCRLRAEAVECTPAVRFSRVRVAHRHCRRSPLCCSPTPGRASCQLACIFVQLTIQRPSPCEVPRLPCTATGCAPEGRDKFVANRAPRRMPFKPKLVSQLLRSRWGPACPRVASEALPVGRPGPALQVTKGPRSCQDSAAAASA